MLVTVLVLLVVLWLFGYVHIPNLTIPDMTLFAENGHGVTLLHRELPGKTLSDVAKAHGKNAADVATALKNAAHTRIDQEVTAGRLTADQATQQKQQADQRIDQQMTMVVPQPPAGA